jgi:hypothetical protein
MIVKTDVGNTIMSYIHILKRENIYSLVEGNDKPTPVELLLAQGVCLASAWLSKIEAKRTAITNIPKNNFIPHIHSYSLEMHLEHTAMSST